MRSRGPSAMKFKPSRKLVGIATASAVALFVANPEMYALSLLISSIGLDVFLLFLTFQLKDQLGYVVSLASCLLRKDATKSVSDGSHEALASKALGKREDG